MFSSYRSIFFLGVNYYDLISTLQIGKEVDKNENLRFSPYAGLAERSCAGLQTNPFSWKKRFLYVPKELWTAVSRITEFNSPAQLLSKNLLYTCECN
jgi:hypothetical protein